MKISIIIPIYNAAKYLRSCLESVRLQTHEDWECLCVDDESTDESGTIAEEYARRDSRFIVVHKKNGGVSSARNAGLALATGDYITFLDNDDLICREWFAAAVRIIETKKPDLLRFETQYQRDEPEGFLARRFDCSVETHNGADAFMWAWRFITNRGFVWLCFIKRDLAQGFRFDHRLIVKDDVVFLSTLFLKLQRICYAPFRGHFYRNTPGSGIKARRHAVQCSAFIENFRKNLERQCEYANKIGFGDDLERLVIQAARDEVIEWACRPDNDDAKAKKLIREEYDYLISKVHRSLGWANQFRYLPGFIVWRLSGCINLITIVGWLAEIKRRIKQ